MATIRLHALREDDQHNYETDWRYRTQFLGSILLWAYRAGATHIEYNPDASDPFVYTDALGMKVESEFPQPPDGLRDGMIESLFIDTIDGHPIARPIRRFVRRWSGKQASGQLTAPDSDNKIESKWTITAGARSASFELRGTSPYMPS